MDYFRGKYRAGHIDVKNFERIIEVLNHLEERQYTFQEVLGEGSFGFVIKVKHLTTGEELAVKVVQKDHVSESEVNLWKTLSHNNILRLIDVQYVYYADSFIFLTPVYPTNLEQLILNPSFKPTIIAVQEAIKFLNQIVDAVHYLHDKDLSHNDVKPNNILMTDNNTAILADFGFLASTKSKIKKYGAPFIYRCPEGRLTEAGLTEIDGKKLDVWCIGMLAFEIFSGMVLLKEFSKWDGPLSCWFTGVYPVLQTNLKKNRFLKLMNDVYPSSKGINETADDIIDFITTCLIIIPEKRPTVQELKNHKLFGGTWKRTHSENDVDIWGKITTVAVFNGILQKNNLAIIPGTEIDDTNHSECSGIQLLDTQGGALDSKDNSEVIQPVDIGEKVSSNQDPQICTVANISNSHENNIVDSNTTLQDNRQSNLKIANNIEINVTEVLEERISPSALMTSHHSSVSLSNEQEVASLRYLFDSPDNTEVYADPPAHRVSEEVANIPSLTQKPSSFQRFRKWWKQQKATLAGLLTACCPCAKKSRTDD